MPFARPTLSELRAQAAADINAGLPGVDARLRYSNVGIMGDVQAALANGQYGYLDWIARQSVPFTATDEALEGWAALRGVTRKGARRAAGTVTFAAEAGATIATGADLVRRDGVAYHTTADAIAADGAIIVPVRAVDAGALGNAVVGTAMTLSSGAAGVNADGTVAAALTGGADIEADQDLRSRMLAAYAAPPASGSIADYPRWARDVPGVSRAWMQRGTHGPGTIGIYFLMDSGFPQGTDGVSAYEDRDTVATGDQLIVADAIFPLQSATAVVYAIAPIPNRVTLTIAGISDATAETKAAIDRALDYAFFLGGAPGGVTNLSSIEAAIAAIPAAAGFVITNIAASAGTVTPGSAGNITSNPGALPIKTPVVYQ
jgi:uncharacterized phage protein gp47/JayE